MFKNSKFSAGFFVGFGVGFVSRDLLSTENSMTRPVVKGFIKAGVNLMEKGRESVAHLFETVEDLLAEVRSEKKIDHEKEKERVVAQAPTQVKVNVSKSS